MAMERRMNVLFSHLTGTNEESAANHISLMNCSRVLNSAMPRCDNRTLFARQGSLSQGSFMREVSITENFKQAASVPEDLSPTCLGTRKPLPGIPEGPMFSRPVQGDGNFFNGREYQTVRREVEYDSAEPPKFARPNKGICGVKQPIFKKINTSYFNGVEWSPRMDIAEYGWHYVVTIEVPGISTNDIRVEVDDSNLVVTGRRSTLRRGMANVSEDSNPKYLRKEIEQGPYQVVWPLPNNVNKDGVSAEFVDGLLQITLPKL